VLKQAVEGVNMNSKTQQVSSRTRWDKRFSLTKVIVLLVGGILCYYIAVSIIMVDDLKTEGKMLKVDEPANPIP